MLQQGALADLLLVDMDGNSSPGAIGWKMLETETVQATVTAVYSARSLLKTRSTSSSSWETTGTLGRSGWGAARSRTFSTEFTCRLRGNKQKINLMNLCKYSRNSNKTTEQDDGL